MATQVGDSQTIDATASPVDAGGNVAQVEAGSAAWAVTDTSIVTVEVDTTNELHATFTPVGPLGTVTVSVTADANLGDGVETITGTADLEVIGGAAAGFTLAFGNPAPKA